jgi:hypothetical protein
MTPANNHKFITCSEASRSFDKPYEVVFSVKIDTFSNSLNELQPVMIGIVNAIEQYVKENQAENLYNKIMPAIEAEVQRCVKNAVEKRCLEILSKLDLDAMAKMASIGAAKKLGLDSV